MTIARLRDAAEAAEALASGTKFKITLFIQAIGVVVKAYDSQRYQAYVISWEQLDTSNINPLLPAIKIVSEAFQAETSDAKG